MLGHGPQDVGHVGIGSGEALAAVHHKDNRVGLVDREPGLLAGAAVHLGLGQIRVVLIEEQAGGIGNSELTAIPERLAVEPVAGGARLILDDRAALADQAVEKGRLAHIGPADNGDNWF